VNLGERLDALLDELPDEAVTISHDPGSDYRVCTIVIDWRLVPAGLLGLDPERRLRVVGRPAPEAGK
jgi:hypothetical protein